MPNKMIPFPSTKRLLPNAAGRPLLVARHPRCSMVGASRALPQAAPATTLTSYDLKTRSTQPRARKTLLDSFFMTTSFALARRKS